jgi:hypothetical protein
MSLETSSPVQPELSAAEIAIVEQHMSPGSGLSVDYINAFAAYMSFAAGGKEYLNVNFFEPVETYQEYFAKSNPRTYDLVMALSIPEAVVMLTGMVGGYNLVLPELIANSDTERVLTLLGEIMNYVYDGEAKSDT